MPRVPDFSFEGRQEHGLLCGWAEKPPALLRNTSFFCRIRFATSEDKDPKGAKWAGKCFIANSAGLY